MDQGNSSGHPLFSEALRSILLAASLQHEHARAVVGTDGAAVDQGPRGTHLLLSLQEWMISRPASPGTAQWRRWYCATLCRALSHGVPLRLVERHVVEGLQGAERGFNASRRADGGKPIHVSDNHALVTVASVCMWPGLLAPDAIPPNDA